MIKCVGERLEIDVRRVHVTVKFRTCVVGDVPRSYGDRFDSAFATRQRDVDRVLGEDHRIIVSEGHGSTAEAFSRERDLLWRRGVSKLVPLARFGDIPVLTKPAAEIASGRAEREHARARQKMVQRFLLNRIDTKPAAAAIGGQHHPIADPLPNETKSALAIVELAKPRTQSALNALIRQHRPPAARIIRLRHLCDHSRQYRSGNLRMQELKQGSDYNGNANDTISFAARWFDQKFPPSKVNERHANGTTAISSTSGVSCRGSTLALRQASLA